MKNIQVLLLGSSSIDIRNAQAALAEIKELQIVTTLCFCVSSYNIPAKIFSDDYDIVFIGDGFEDIKGYFGAIGICVSRLLRETNYLNEINVSWKGKEQA